MAQQMGNMSHNNTTRLDIKFWEPLYFGFQHKKVIVTLPHICVYNTKRRHNLWTFVRTTSVVSKLSLCQALYANEFQLGTDLVCLRASVWRNSEMDKTGDDDYRNVNVAQEENVASVYD